MMQAVKANMNLKILLHPNYKKPTTKTKQPTTPQNIQNTENI